MKQYTSTIMVVGNIAVGKTTLINCLVKREPMRDISIAPTTSFELKNVVISLPSENAELTIKFVDVAGTNQAGVLIEQFA